MIPISIFPRYIRKAHDYASSGTLTVSSSAYSANDYLHDGVISFPVFNDSNYSAILLKKIIVKETITAGTLAKKAFKLYLFNSCDLTVTANGDFDFADGTSTLSDLAGFVTVATANYTDVKSGANTYDSIVDYDLITPKLIPNKGLGRYLYGIAVTTDTTAYDATALVSIELVYEVL